MAADLSHLSLAQFQNLSQQQKLSWNWTKGHLPEESNNSWELRAFKDDQATRSTAWLPRAYTCTFCHREFKSAQALGGHMNVHRRDRARLRQSSQEVEPTPTTINASHNVMSPCEDRSSIFYPMDGTSSLDLLREHVIRENKHDESSDVMVVEEVDLELRLGW